jgi:aminotransferase
MNAENLLNDRAKELKQGSIRAMFDKASTMQNVISMGIGEPDLHTPAPICQACADALMNGITHYTPNAGFPVLREAVSKYCFDIPGLYDPATEIIITNGGMGALSMLMLVMLQPGDQVLIQNPQWLNYAAQIKYCGGEPVGVPTTAENNFIMTAEDIRKCYVPGKTKALIINSPNNPTGEVVSREELEKIAKLACELDLFVVSDEVYNTLLYEGAEAVSISSFPGMKERTAVINSFSKSYAMTGWRVGFTAAPAPLVRRMTLLQENFNSCVNAAAQMGAVYALEHPELKQELNDSLTERRTIALEGMRAIPGMKCGNPKGAFYLFPDIRAFGMSSEEFCNRLLEEAGVVCIPGSAFGSCGEGYIRLSYTAKKDALIEAMERMKNFCARYI